MSVTIWDHLFGLCLILLLPLIGAWKFRRLKARLAAGEEDARNRSYRAVIVEEVALAGIVVALWLGLDRSWGQLAPAVPVDWAWLPWAGWGIAVAGSVLLVVQAVALARDETAVAEARRQMEPIADFLPHTAGELRSFRVVSVAAGVGEEVVFRGFALAWLTALAAGGAGLGEGLALAVGVLGSSLIFGLAHAYQGLSGVLKTGTVGMLLAGVAVATGGLLAPMVLHTVVDLTSGQVAYHALWEGREGAPAMVS
jgi:uncharacterized protein